MDVTNAFNLIFNLIFDGLSFCFDTLDSITYRGVSLLDFFIWLFVLGIIIPVIITILPSRTIESYAEIRPDARAVRSVRSKINHYKGFKKAYDEEWDKQGEFF